MEPIYGSVQMQAILEAVLDKREARKRALTQALFPESSAVTLPTGSVQWDMLQGTLGMAPFVEINGKAVTTERLSGGTAGVETPSINLKRPVTANTVMLARQAGDRILTGLGEDPISKHIAKTIADDLIDMDDLIRNRIEWMAAMVLRGDLNYSVEGKASFKLSTGKPVGNTFTVNNLWTAATATPMQDIQLAKRIVNAYSAPAFKAAICGRNASQAIMNMMEKGTMKSLETTSGISAGSGTFLSEWSDNGMLYLGNFGGTPFFEYSGTYESDDGTGSAPLIRENYIEFIPPYSPSTNKTFYGAINDIEAIMSNRHIAQRFSTQVMDKDAGTLVNYLKSRPLPWMLRPEWAVSMKVTVDEEEEG